MKTKIFCFNLISALFLTLLFFPFCAQGATTFPTDQAGIAAYTKLDSFDASYFDKLKNGLFESVDAVGETYIIGVKNYAIGDNADFGKTKINIYLATNGWLVAYLSKSDQPSKIVNWRANATLNNTLLKIAIDEAAQTLGATISTPIKYYDFSNPQAAKIAFAKESIEGYDTNYSHNFSVMIPGTLHQAFWTADTSACTVYYSSPFTLLVDNQSAGTNESQYTYGSYDATILNDRKSHTIRLDRNNNCKVSAVSVFLYTIN